MVASALSSPVGVKSPLHKGKVAVDGVVDVRGGAVVAERHDTKPKAVARQPRDLAEKPKEPKPEHARGAETAAAARAHRVRRGFVFEAGQEEEVGARSASGLV
jgi:hypothetical protein